MDLKPLELGGAQKCLFSPFPALCYNNTTLAEPHWVPLVPESKHKH